jgi:hypothetical protein
LPLSSFKEGDCEGRLISGFVEIFAVLSLAKEKISTLPQSLPHDGEGRFFHPLFRKSKYSHSHWPHAEWVV